MTATPEFRAAGTDLSERRRSGVSKGPVIDLVLPGDDGIIWGADGAATIGAFATIETIAADKRIKDAYPGIAATALGLATPQIRHLATIGGNLAQRSRCWYFRNPHIACLKKGGSDCPARAGNHLYSVAFDLGPCVAPHPSSMAAALLAYDAVISHRSPPKAFDRRAAWRRLRRPRRSRAAGWRIHPQHRAARAAAGERAHYKRAISRSYAEWPLVEVCARAVIADGAFRSVRIAAGGIAARPLRLRASEAVLEGRPPTEATIANAAKLVTDGAKPLPMTGYKLELLNGLVRDLLTQMAA